MNTRDNQDNTISVYTIPLRSLGPSVYTTTCAEMNMINRLNLQSEVTHELDSMSSLTLFNQIRTFKFQTCQVILPNLREILHFKALGKFLAYPHHIQMIENAISADSGVICS